MKKLKYIKLYETYWNLDDTFKNREIQLYFNGESTPRKYYISTIMPADFYVGLTETKDGEHSIGITYISKNHPKWNKDIIGKWFEYDMLKEELGVEVEEKLTIDGILPQIVNHCKWDQ